MQIYFDYVMDKYLRKYIDKISTKITLPSLTFNMRHNTTKHAWYDPNKVAIFINSVNAKHATDDFVKGLIYHEAIHYTQDCMRYVGYERNGGHDAFFIRCMNEINIGEGKQYVNIKDESIQYSAKEYIIVGFFLPNGDGYYGISRNGDADIDKLRKVANRYGTTAIFSFPHNSGFIKGQLPSFSAKNGKLASFEKSDNREYEDLANLAKSNLL